MKKLFTLSLFLLFAAVAIAQPANDGCATATVIVPNGSCITGTTTAADDSWIGSVGCQTNGSHNDVWYQFVATDNQLNFTVNSLGMGNNIEVIVAYSPCGTCACSFQIHGDACGTAPLTDSVVGLNVGGTYFITISSSGADGSFELCTDLVQAVNTPGQDCPTAVPICDQSPFSIPTVASGNGSIRGNGSQEDISAISGSCFGSDERQSQWYRFTASTSGTIEFNINPNVASNDYDWILLNVTSAGCNLNSTPAPVVECDWSGCDGSTGMSSAPASEPGVITGGAGCFGGPAAWEPPANIVAGQTYLLLIDNFSLSNNGFSFTWGGVNNTMTSTIGPSAIDGFTATLTAPGCTTVTISGVTNVPNYTYNWTWGDGTSSTGPNPAPHVYSTPGTYTITQTITDAIGCQVSTSQTLTCILAAGGIDLNGKANSHEVSLNWNISGAIHGEKQAVLRSTNGTEFQTLTSWNSTELTQQWTDTAPPQGKAWYQVQVTDKNGVTHSSSTIEVVTDMNALVTINGNPAQDQLKFTLANGLTAAEVWVYDMQGRTVGTGFSFSGAEGQVNIASLAPGIYWLNVKTAEGTSRVRFVKE